LSARARAGGMELSLSAGGERRLETSANRAAASGHRARVESAAAITPAVQSSRVPEAANRSRSWRSRGNSWASSGPLCKSARRRRSRRYRSADSLTDSPFLDQRAVGGSRCEHSRGRYADRGKQHQQDAISRA
jgi:hypothetical protein